MRRRPGVSLAGAVAILPSVREVTDEALRAREETMSTGIGLGIAIPHASSDRVSQVVAAFGRSSKGIEFAAAVRPVEGLKLWGNAAVINARFGIHAMYPA